MNLTYEVKDLYIILLKKWYIILFTIAIFAIISYPIALQSKESVTDNYNALTSEKSTDLNNSIKDTVIFYKVSTNQSGAQKDDMLASTIAENIVLFVKEITEIDEDEKYDINKNILTWNQAFSEDFKIANMYDIPVIMISFQDSKEDYDTFISEFPRFVNSKIAPIMGEDFTLELADKSVFEYTSEEFNRTILSTPLEISSRTKIMVTSSVLGLLVSVLVILIYDFRKTSKKLMNF